MKLYVFYTPSHQSIFASHFFPSLQDDFDIVIEASPQECPSGEFGAAGWTETMKRKVDLILRAIKENDGGVFVYSDVDVKFFGPVIERLSFLLKDNDILFQRNDPRGTVCAGFFICRANQRTHRLWSEVYSRLGRFGTRGDQAPLNQVLVEDWNGTAHELWNVPSHLLGSKVYDWSGAKNRHGVKWDYLPLDFQGGGTLTGLTFDGTNIGQLPGNLLMYHANFSTGIPSKIRQFDLVESHLRMKACPPANLSARLVSTQYRIHNQPPPKADRGWRSAIDWVLIRARRGLFRLCIRPLRSRSSYTERSRSLL